jgi:hypothetical protein
MLAKDNFNINTAFLETTNHQACTVAKSVSRVYIPKQHAFCSKFAVPLCFVKVHTTPSSIVSGILKCEWAVLPPGIMEAATPYSLGVLSTRVLLHFQIK